jgi:hemerythrin-like domain-containing protein
MCQNCGCLANTVINELTDEHDAVVTLIRSVAEHLAADRVSETARICQQISALLAPHTIVEEQGLFPELYAEFPEHLDALVDEHRRVERVLAEAAAGVPTDPSWPERLHDALGLLREHILKEQDGVFPAAVIALDGEAWERVQNARHRPEVCTH